MALNKIKTPHYLDGHTSAGKGGDTLLKSNMEPQKLF